MHENEKWNENVCLKSTLPQLYLLTYKLRTNWAKVNDKIWPIFSTKSTQICMKTSLTCLLRGY